MEREGGVGFEDVGVRAELEARERGGPTWILRRSRRR
jgi:hypothetical protein